MDRKTRIAVVGAGLGGMTVAGFLQRAGFAVTIYEQAPAFSRIGAGIILSANVMKVLRRLGLEQMVVEIGIKANCYISRAWDTGETMYKIDFDAESEARFGGPYANIHRGDLHAVLEKGVAPGSIAFNHRLVALDETTRCDPPRVRQRRDGGGRYRHRRRRRELQGAGISAGQRTAALRRDGRASGDLPDAQRCAASRFPTAPNGGVRTGTSSSIS